MFLPIILFSLFTSPLTNTGLGTLQGSNSRTNFNNIIAKPNCPTHCGNVAVPYPFGIGNDTGCSIEKSLHLTCNTSYETPKLFLSGNFLEIYNISDSEVRIVSGVSFRCYNQNGSLNYTFSWYIYLPEAFKFSQKNTLTVLGCDDYSVITDTSSQKSYSGCLGQCSSAQDVPDNGTCSGMGCCQTSIPKGLDYYKGTLDSLQNHTTVWPFNRCGYTFLGEAGSFAFRGARDLNNNSGFVKGIEAIVPIVVDWVIAPGGDCSDQSTECKGNSSCYEVDGGGYRCRCNNGFEGNPYLDPGC